MDHKTKGKQNALFLFLLYSHIFCCFGWGGVRDKQKWGRNKINATREKSILLTVYFKGMIRRQHNWHLPSWFLSSFLVDYWIGHFFCCQLRAYKTKQPVITADPITITEIDNYNIWTWRCQLLQNSIINTWFIILEHVIHQTNNWNLADDSSVNSHFQLIIIQTAVHPTTQEHRREDKFIFIFNT